MQYAEVLVDAKTQRGTFHYSIPAKLLPDVRRGSLVRVPFRTREIDGIVVDLSRRIPRGLPKAKVRQLSKVVEPQSLLTQELIALADWMASHYLCSFADALFTILPPFPQKARVSEERRAPQRKRLTGTYFVHGREVDRWHRYLQAIEKVVGRDEQVVVVFPDRSRALRFLEIAKKNFSTRAILYSADLAKATRFRTWQRIRSGEYDLIVGTRLAVFAPASRLGLLLLDEESHPGHKDTQHPRYHAREVAIRRSELEGVPLLIGNLLPTVRTFAETSTGAIKTIDLPEPTALTTIVDIKNQRSLLSPTAEDAIEHAARSIVFTTRLGAGAATRCQDCNHLFRCPNCTLPLTLHDGRELRCHHCGHKEPLPAFCPNCHGSSIRSMGLGTESLETYLGVRFPGRKIERIEANRPLPEHWDILVATVKILDTTFSAPLVVVSSLDTMLELPDPFAVERAAQLLVQLRDRATHEFIVQTRLPDHRVFRVLEDEEQFLTEELALRRSQRYPPAITLVRVLFHGEDQLKVATKLTDLATKLRDELPPNGATALGPGPAFYDRLKGKYRWHLLIKLLTDDRKIRSKLKELLPDDILIDVNPVDIL